MYDSDKQSNSQSQQQSSSQQQEQGISAQQKQKRQSQKRLKKAIAYRYYDHKFENKIKQSFLMWKDQALTNYRSGVVTAIRHYENKLMEKGFDGVLQYASNTTLFRKKLVLWYYKIVISRAFMGWLNVYNSKQLASSGEQFSSYIKRQVHNQCYQAINQVNKNLDQLLNKNIGIKQEPKTYKYENEKNTQRISSKNRETKGDEDWRKQKIQKKQPKVLNSYDLIKFQSAVMGYVKEYNATVGFRAIQTYIRQLKPTGTKSTTNIPVTPKNVLPPMDINNTFLTQREKQRQPNMSSSIYSRINRTDFNQNSNWRSRADVQFRDTDKSKSRRKYKPITETVELPHFGIQSGVPSHIPTPTNKRKIQYQRQSEQRQRPKQQYRQPQIQRKKEQQMRQVQNQQVQGQKQKLIQQQKNKQKQLQLRRQKQRQLETQKQRQLELQKEKQRQKERERQRQKQKQRQKQRQKMKANQVRNNILSIITKSKLLQLSIIKQYQKQLDASSNVGNQCSQKFDRIKKDCIESLNQIKNL